MMTTTQIPSSSWTADQLKLDRYRVNENMKASNRNFSKQVLPVIMASSSFVSYTCCETASLETLEKDLDRKFGIDYILHRPDGTQAQCMVRMTVKDNFTIRTATRGFSESEFQKRLRQWANGELSRNVSYIHGVQNQSKTKTTHFYIVNAYELYTAVQDNRVEYEKCKNAEDNSEYVAITPKAVADAGISIRKVVVKS